MELFITSFGICANYQKIRNEIEEDDLLSGTTFNKVNLKSQGKYQSDPFEETGLAKITKKEDKWIFFTDIDYIVYDRKVMYIIQKNK